jgi:hypothetical protein
MSIFEIKILTTMASFTMTKKPTKRDYVVELAKLYNIKINSKSAIELMVQTLNKALEEEPQFNRAVKSTLPWDGSQGSNLNYSDWDKIKLALNTIRLEMDLQKDDSKLSELFGNKKKQKETVEKLRLDFEKAKQKLELATYIWI